MDSLRVGVVLRWPEVEGVVVAMLEALGHRTLDAQARDTQPPDVVVRDARCDPPGGWAGRPEVVLSGSSSGMVIETAGMVRMGKPFSREELDAAIRLAVGRVV
jgi:hypothetical protein